MIIRRKPHDVPGLNTTSTADISFMLLIFFLVTTSMDVDKGITRQLPAMDPKEEVVEEALVDKHNMLDLRITATNQLTIDGQPAQVKDLRERTLQLVRRVGEEHVIALDCDPNADYNSYFQVQNQLVSAYTQWREEVAQRKYKKPFARLTPDQQAEVRKLCPHRVAERADEPQAPAHNPTEKGGTR